MLLYFLSLCFLFIQMSDEIRRDNKLCHILRRLIVVLQPGSKKFLLRLPVFMNDIQAILYHDRIRKSNLVPGPASTKPA